MPSAPKTRIGICTPAFRRTMPSSISAHASISAPARSSASPTLADPCPYAFALTTAMTRGARRAVRCAARDAAIARRFASIAPRSTIARVGRITFYRRTSSPGLPYTLARAARSQASHRLVVFELGELSEERETHAADRAVAVFADDDFRSPGLLGLRLLLVVDLGAIDEHDEIRVLLERARFTEVGELRTVIRPRFRRAAQLGERDDRDVQFLREDLHRSGN